MQDARGGQDARRRGTVVNRLSRPGDRRGGAQEAGPGTGGGDPDARYRFLARFGATILSGGIAAIPTSLYHYQAELRLAPQEVWFVGYILAHRWTDALPYPSLRQMSRRTGISTQMLHRYKQSLVEKGYLATIPRHRPSGGRTSNSYDFSGLFARLEQLLRRDRRDPAWQPTADESEEQEQDALEDFGGEAEQKGAAPPAVPPSQQSAPPDGVLLQGHRNGGRQRTLPAPAQPRATGPGRRALPTGAPPPSPAPVIPTGPQESRSLLLRQEDEIQRRAGPATTATGPQAETAGESGTRERSTIDNKERPAKRVGAATDGQGERTERTERTGLAGERARRNIERGVREGPAPLPAQSLPCPPLTALPTSASPEPPADPADVRWASVCRILAAELTPAAVSAWLRPLTPVALAPAPDRGGLLLVLACNTAFHRDHVLRRYRAAIERAAGAACEVVVRPAQPESGTGTPAPAAARPEPALAPAPAPSPPP
ncbi:MAG TPA: hypothetical protein VHQ00_04990, partial [Chloroflexota bacterium]|nr:hypothetical protein [Chloroflexota bacterium]